MCLKGTCLVTIFKMHFERLCDVSMSFTSTKQRFWNEFQTEVCFKRVKFVFWRISLVVRSSYFNCSNVWFLFRNVWFESYSTVLSSDHVRFVFSKLFFGVCSVYLHYYNVWFIFWNFCFVFYRTLVSFWHADGIQDITLFVLSN